MTAHTAFEGHGDAIAGDITMWLKSALNPDHGGTPMGNQITAVYLLADIASALNRIAKRLDQITNTEGEN